MIQIKKTILTLVALLAVTTGAWAEEQSETFTTTATIVEGTHFTISNNDDYADSDGMTAKSGITVTPKNGETITKVVISCTWDPGHVNNGNTSVSSGTKEITNGGGTITVTGVNASTFTFTCSNGDPQFGQFVVYYTEASVASSGPEVAWDKATKTGTFKMPGGNVTLEPEYYPQAALTAAPTAINDVPATTDGAIVNAGTVANIGETETAQGTVMYYVSPTEMTDETLLALAADQWTADVPTAESLAEGQAYVYYYVRGNDSNNDEENFSDGDILAANALTVTIAAEPTYAVTFADGVNPEPPAEPEWTASPATGVKKGETVTVTYTGSKKVIGVKAEKKAAAPTYRLLSAATAEDVGKIAGKDGKIYATKADAEAVATGNAVAMIAYVGTASDCAHGLAIALADESGTKEYGAAGTACSGKAAVTGGTWRLPSIKDWQYMFIGCGASGSYSGNPSSMSYSGLASKLNTAQGDALQTVEYWSSTESSPGSTAWIVKFDGSNASFNYKPEFFTYRVRACLAF